MPSSLQTLDTAFPKIDEHQTTEENFLQVTNYLYMLLENLRYTLGNLGEENFNDTELDSIAKLIQEPIWARIEDDEGNIHTLNVTAENLLSQVSDINGNLSTLQQTANTLSSRITNTEGDISTLTQTASSLSSKISDAEGNLSSLSQTVNGLSTKISNAEGNISSLQQTASSLSTKVSNVEGNISSLQQTASSLSTKVSNVEGSISTLTQTVNGFSLSVSNGTSSSTIKLMSGSTVISSKRISFSGMVTFSDLSTKGSTTINGSNITTGTISVDRIKLYGDMRVYKSASDNAGAGSIGYYETGSASGMHFWTSGGEVAISGDGVSMKWTGTKNQIYVVSGAVGFIVTDSSADMSYRLIPNGFYPGASTATLGTPTKLWGQVYSTNSAISQSDANRKNSIEDLPEKYLTLFDRLIPRRYKLNDGTSDRYHVGFIAQEVEAAMTAAGVYSQEFGGFVKDTDEETGEDIYFLRYEEFIGILVAKINALETRINALEVTA